MSDSNAAQDQIKAYVDRILRMKEEAKAINADIREIYAEAKGNGFDKTVLGQLVGYIEKRQTDAATLAQRSALFDLYLEAFDGSSGRPSHAHTRERASGLHYGEHLDDTTKASVDPLAALRANPDMAIVEPSDLKKNTEQQVAPQPASDLAPPQGQVAPIPEAKTSTDGGATEQDMELPADSVTGEASRLAAGRTADVAGDELPASNAGQQGDEQPESVTAGETAPVSETDKSVVASASAAPAPKYAAPGVVTWETFPPEGVERGAISMAFGTMGQDAAVIADELERGAARPIVKKGNVILDGWARYMAARNMRELDGSPMSYPVVQYDGTDLLVDIIKLNVDGRILTDDQKRKIAANLARQEPRRKGDIYKAFEIFLEPV